MAGLSFKHIYKVYPNGTKAVNDFNMEVEDKEFIVFVGPSGCGKSTTLRMVAGLEDISAGELSIGGLVVNDVEPKDRDIAMVFQNYALYPHMTVFENIAFGLRLRKVPDVKRDKDGNPVLDKNGNQIPVMRKYTREEINQKVTEAAEILGITEYLGKKPKEMSGGQRQRVSLGRAIVRQPKVMLLDEPLSNLDAKLRTQMRAEISKLHTKLNTTFIYVTHDQVEAMTMGTRIVVMKEGFVQQIDTPKNLYNYPGNKFVAGFIGTPQMNFFEGYLLRKGDVVEIRFGGADTSVKVPYSKLYKVKPSYLDGETKVIIGLRAEDISIDPEVVQKSDTVIKVKISHKEELGNQTLIYGDMDMAGDGYSENTTRVIIEDRNGTEVENGEIAEVALNMDKVHLFDSETELSIMPRIPQYNYLDCKVHGGKIDFEGVNLTLPPAMECGDGEYELLIPTDAVYLGSGTPVDIISSEKINGQYLFSFDLGQRRLFGLSSEEVSTGKNKVCFDFKKLSLNKDGEAIIKALPEVYGIGGYMFKEKTAAADEKGKIRKYMEFYLNIGGAKFLAPDFIATKLITAIGHKKAFGEQLRFENGPYGFTLGEEGIEGEVCGYADYGLEKFVKVSVGGVEVCVRCDGPVEGTVHLVPDLDTVSVVQVGPDIRII